MKKRKGFAVVIVLFFAFAISIVMFALFRHNSNLGTQTKLTIYQMQAYYLAQSCMQLAKLHIYLLPKEIFEFYQNKSENPETDVIDKCCSQLYFPLDMHGNERIKKDYDLFSNNNSDDNFPYEGYFNVQELKYILSDHDLKMTQDSYNIKVEAKVSLGKGKDFKQVLEENFIVSRFTGR